MCAALHTATLIHTVGSTTYTLQGPRYTRWTTGAPSLHCLRVRINSGPFCAQNRKTGAFAFCRRPVLVVTDARKTTGQCMPVYARVVGNIAVCHGTEPPDHSIVCNLVDFPQRMYEHISHLCVAHCRRHIALFHLTFRVVVVRNCVIVPYIYIYSPDTDIIPSQFTTHID